MAKMHKLKTLQVTSLGTGMHGDGGGLWLQVQGKDQRSWALRYISPRTGKPRQMGLGSVDTVTLKRARDLAIEYRRKIGDGIDPLDERANAVAPTLDITFAEATEAFIASHEVTWKHSDYAEKWRDQLTTHAYPVIGKLPIHAIGVDHMLAVLKPIWTTLPPTATIVRGRIQRVLSYGYASSKLPRPARNPAMWLDNLDILLASPSAVWQSKHHPAMPYAEIPKFMARLAHQTEIQARCLEYLILNACRCIEARTVCFDHISLTDEVWTGAAELMKGRKGRGKAHRFPLSWAAMKLIRSIRENQTRDTRDGDVGLLFPGQKRHLPLCHASVGNLLDQMGVVGPTIHGFRSAFFDWAVDSGRYSDTLANKQLAHGVKDEEGRPDKVRGAYFRTDMLDLRRPMMNAWADYVMSGTQAMAVAA